MSDVHSFSVPDGAADARWRLMYFDANWNEIESLRFEAAKTHLVLTSLYQWLMAHAVPDDVPQANRILRRAVAFQIEEDDCNG